MTTVPVYPVSVFYDGSCRVCSGEMAAYRRRDHGGRLRFVDISDPAFEPGAHGIGREAFMDRLHVIDREGAVYQGPDAFRVIWLAFPGSRWFSLLAALIDWPLVRPAARLAYRLFARVRHYLPRYKRAACKTGRRPPR